MTGKQVKKAWNNNLRNTHYSDADFEAMAQELSAYIKELESTIKEYQRKFGYLDDYEKDTKLYVKGMHTGAELSKAQLAEFEKRLDALEKSIDDYCKIWEKRRNDNYKGADDSIWLCDSALSGFKIIKMEVEAMSRNLREGK